MNVAPVAGTAAAMTVHQRVADVDGAATAAGWLAAAMTTGGGGRQQAVDGGWLVDAGQGAGGDGDGCVVG